MSSAGLAPARPGELHFPEPGDDRAAAPALDSRLHDPDLAPGGVDAQASAPMAASS